MRTEILAKSAPKVLSWRPAKTSGQRALPKKYKNYRSLALSSKNYRSLIG